MESEKTKRCGGCAIFVLVACLLAPPAVKADRDLDFKLFAAAKEGRTAEVLALLESGAHRDARNRLGETPLMLAIQGQHRELTVVLIERGADVNKPNLKRVSPLHVAVYQQDQELVRALLDGGADATAVDNTLKGAICYAAANGDVEIVRILLDRGVNVNAIYGNDLTALMWAAGYGQEDVIKLLLERGADPGLRDNRGQTAREMAEQGGHPKAAELLRNAVAG